MADCSFADIREPFIKEKFERLKLPWSPRDMFGAVVNWDAKGPKHAERWREIERYGLWKK